MSNSVPLTCTIDDCAKNLRAKGMCAMHYARFKRTGSTGARPKATVRAKCSMDECEKLSSCGGLCSMHDSRLRRKGTTDARDLAPIGSTHVSESGYVYVKMGSRDYRLGHRLVMQQVLGRELLPGENVHHRNGVRHDNRSENLELWVTSQPSGQRPEDLVEWAHEILRRYA